MDALAFDAVARLVAQTLKEADSMRMDEDDSSAVTRSALAMFTLHFTQCKC
jgi:hypothetical protein